MAEMIPSTMPSTASAGEVRLFHVLSRLPDDVIVYYEPVIRGRYPDFIVLIPRLGVVVIEAKGWRIGAIVTADSHSVLTAHDGVQQRSVHPTRQAREYMYALMDEAKAVCGDRLLQRSGPHQGRFAFPFTHFVLMNNCSRAQLDARGLSRVFLHPSVVARDELSQWEDLEPSALVDAFRGFFDPWWAFPPLSPAQIGALRGVIHPEVRLDPVTVDDDDAGMVRVLDLRQERNALSIGDGHRVIYGVAGSGKTVLLLARAKLLGEQGAGDVLLLCYNKALAEFFRGALRDYPRVRAVHFHGWAAAQGVRFDPEADEDSFGELVERRLLEGDGERGRYTAVLIDEAQDFACSWFKAAKLALKAPEEGDFVIVGDGNQAVYRRRKFTWSEAGVRAQGRTINLKFDLDTNYRNTREIMRLAQRFARPHSEGEETIASIASVEGTCVRSGPAPQVVRAANVRAEAICRLRDVLGRFKPSDIGVIYRANTGHWVSGLARALAQEFPLNWVQAPRDWPYPQSPDGLTLTTAHSSKGLQWRFVLLLRPEQMPFVSAADAARLRNGAAADAEALRCALEQQERGLMYVALTRAVDELLVLYQTEAGFARLLLDA